MHVKNVFIVIVRACLACLSRSTHSVIWSVKHKVVPKSSSDWLYEDKSWTKCLSRRFVFSFRRLSFRCVTSLLCFVVLFAISSCFVLSFRRFDVSLCHFLASFRRPSCNFVLSSPRFVVSLFRFVTSLVVSSLRCFVSSFRFTVSFRRFNCAGLGTRKGTIRVSITWSGYRGLAKMASLLRSEELLKDLSPPEYRIHRQPRKRAVWWKQEWNYSCILSRASSLFYVPPELESLLLRARQMIVVVGVDENHYRDDCLSLQDAEDVQPQILQRRY